MTCIYCDHDTTCHKKLPIGKETKHGVLSHLRALVFSLFEVF